MALATDLEGETVEDQVLQIDLESGEVTHIVDFTQVFQSYFDITRPVQATDPSACGARASGIGSI